MRNHNGSRAPEEKPLQWRVAVRSDDDQVRRRFEPGADPIEERLAALGACRAAGVPTFAIIQPMLPMDPGRLVARLEKALAGRPAAATVLVSHQPVFAGEASRAGVGLMLSGHTHDGQIWPFRYVVRLEMPYLAGRYDVVHAVEEAAHLIAPFARLLRVPLVMDVDSSIPDQLRGAYGPNAARFGAALIYWPLWVERKLSSLLTLSESIQSGYAAKRSVSVLYTLLTYFP